MVLAISKYPPKSDGIGPRGRRAWRDLVSRYEFDDDEVDILRELARCVDRLDLLDAEIVENGMTSLGSMGQVVANPALAEARQQQALLVRLRKALRLTERKNVAAPVKKASVARSGVRGRFQVIENAG